MLTAAKANAIATKAAQDPNLYAVLRSSLSKVRAEAKKGHNNVDLVNTTSASPHFGPLQNELSQLGYSVTVVQNGGATSAQFLRISW